MTGSRDATVIVWDVLLTAASNGAFVREVPRHVLYGHDDEVTCVTINTDLDIVASGSLDGTMILYEFRSGEYLRTISVSSQYAVTEVAISSNAYLAALCAVRLSFFC